jgi:transcriptional regulator GlxA family with amidase domain
MLSSALRDERPRSRSLQITPEIGAGHGWHSARSSAEAVEILLKQALHHIANDPDAARQAVAEAASIMGADEPTDELRYRLLPIPGGLNPWQEKRAKELLEAGLTAPFSVETIASECQLPLPQFRRAFERTTGLSPLRWLRQLRVERAKELLYASSLSLAQITYECGFSDQPHLTRAFSAATGVSPGAWRRARKPG